MKMGIVEIVVVGIISVGIFFGGWFVRDLTKPQTVIQNNKQETTVNQKTQSIQQNLQIQETVFSPNTNISISIKDYTNKIFLTNYAITNYNTHTNAN